MITDVPKMTSTGCSLNRSASSRILHLHLFLLGTVTQKLLLLLHSPIFPNWLIPEHYCCCISAGKHTDINPAVQTVIPASLGSCQYLFTFHQTFHELLHWMIAIKHLATLFAMYQLPPALSTHTNQIVKHKNPTPQRAEQINRKLFFFSTKKPLKIMAITP